MSKPTSSQPQPPPPNLGQPLFSPPSTSNSTTTNTQTTIPLQQSQQPQRPADPPSKSEVERKLSVKSAAKSIVPPKRVHQQYPSGYESDSSHTSSQAIGSPVTNNYPYSPTLAPSSIIGTGITSVGSGGTSVGGGSVAPTTLSAIVERRPSSGGMSGHTASGSGIGEEGEMIDEMDLLEENEEGVEGAESDELDEQAEAELQRGMEGERVYKSGYLWKKQERRKVWKRKWFVLRTNKLAYYKDDREYSLSRVIDLHHVHTVAPVSVKKHSFAFGIVTSKRTFFAKASSQDDMDEWVKAINNVRRRMAEREEEEARRAQAVKEKEKAASALGIGHASVAPQGRGQGHGVQLTIPQQQANNMTSIPSPISLTDASSTSPAPGSYFTPRQGSTNVPGGGAASPIDGGNIFTSQMAGISLTQPTSSHSTSIPSLASTSHTQAGQGLASASRSAPPPSADFIARRLSNPIVPQSIALGGGSMSGSSGSGPGIGASTNTNIGVGIGGPVGVGGGARRAPSIRRDPVPSVSTAIAGGPNNNSAVSSPINIPLGGVFPHAIDSSPRAAASTLAPHSVAGGAFSSEDEEEDAYFSDPNAAFPHDQHTISPPQFPQQAAAPPQLTQQSMTTVELPQQQQQSSAVDPNKIILSAYLMKRSKGRGRKMWRKRWFYLTSQGLTYTKSHMESRTLRFVPLASILDAIDADSASDDSGDEPSSSLTRPLTHSLSQSHSHGYGSSIGPGSGSVTSGGAGSGGIGGSGSGGGASGLAGRVVSRGGTTGSGTTNATAASGDNVFRIITSTRTYVLCAPTEEDEIKWLAAVRALLNRERERRSGSGVGSGSGGIGVPSGIQTQQRQGQGQAHHLGESPRQVPIVTHQPPTPIPSVLNGGGGVGGGVGMTGEIPGLAQGSGQAGSFSQHQPAGTETGVIGAGGHVGQVGQEPRSRSATYVAKSAVADASRRFHEAAAH